MNTLYEITREALAQYKENKNKSKEGLDLSDFVNARKPARVENGVGWVHVYGCLLRDSTPIDRALGNTDYADIAEDLETVIEQGAKSIVLVCDSGGGTVAGAIECARAIQSCSVPVVAFISGTGASAAYKLASSSTYIIASESAAVGNIGSILIYCDETAYHKAIGITPEAFVNDGATLKSTGHLDGFTEEQKAFLQESINESGAAFQSYVLENRPAIDRETFKAGWYNGQRAVDLGLIDEIGSEERAAQVAAQLAATFFDTTLNS